MVLKQIGHGVDRIEGHGNGRIAGHIVKEQRAKEAALRERARRMRQRPRARESENT